MALYRGNVVKKWQWAELICVVWDTAKSRTLLVDEPKRSTMHDGEPWTRALISVRPREANGSGSLLRN